MQGTFLQHAYRMLRERHGSLCLIDIVRRPDETLDQFHKRQSEDIQTWEKLGPDGRQALTNHVCTVRCLLCAGTTNVRAFAQHFFEQVWRSLCMLETLTA